MFIFIYSLFLERVVVTKTTEEGFRERVNLILLKESNNVESLGLIFFCFREI